MSITEIQAPPGRPESIVLAEHIVETVQIATAVRDAAVAELATQVAQCDELRRDRDGLLAACLSLQRALDEARVRETALRAEADGHAAHVGELLEERRAWLWQKLRLEATLTDLQRQAKTPAGQSRRGRRNHQRTP